MCAPDADDHPARGPDQLEGSFAAVFGDHTAGGRLARELGMTPFMLADDAKPVYHAASIFASNYLVTLTAVAVGLLERSGMERADALAALRPLQLRTVEVAGDPPTGPIAVAMRSPLSSTWRRLGRPCGRSIAAGASDASSGRSAVGGRCARPAVSVGLVPTMGRCTRATALLQRLGPRTTGGDGLFVNPTESGDSRISSRIRATPARS